MFLRMFFYVKCKIFHWKTQCRKPLELSPFTFDDFEAALRQDEAASSNPIVDQTHWRLLQLASQYTNSLVAKAKPVKTAKTQRRVDSLASSNVTAARYEDELSGSATEDEPSSPMATAAASTAETAAAAAAVTEIDASFPERWWTWRIKKDEWENALCAYLLHLGTVQSVPHLQSIVSKLTGLQAQIDPRDGRADFAYGDRYWNDGESVDFRENYALLNVEEKLECLWLLINESVVPSQRCRKFIEQCSQALAEARKEKRELDVNMRERFVFR
jgi:hypothetical protein